MNASGDRGQQTGRKALLLTAGGYLLFIVYGSLVPLDFNPQPLELAWRDFLAIRYLVLGVESRADWIANLLLYMPLAYLLSAGLAVPRGSAALQLLLSSAVFLACAALALGVEFTQLFFPPRTVSINDIVAELIGSALGIGVWRVWGGALQRLWTEMKSGGLVAIRAAIVAYVLAYLTISLFPYDFYISAQEFSRKLVSDGYGLLVARAGCERLSVCIGKFFAEIVAVVPLGVLLSITLGRAARRAYAIAALYGLLLGFSIETAQLFIASGVSQGVSLLTRAAGLALGVGLHRSFSAEILRRWQPHLRAVTALSLMPYLLAAMWFNGWFSARWGGLEHASSSFDQVKWLPFYYHYFTTETAALVSALASAATYLPIGIGYWLWQFTGTRADNRSVAKRPALMAALLASIIEAGKLFIPGKHPDPTSVLIAAFAAAMAYLVARRFFRWPSGSESMPAGADARHEDSRPPTARSRRGGELLAAGLLLAATGVALVRHPLPSPWLLIGLAGYALVIWRFPSATLPAVLALLPLLNLALWTGWIMLDEFDLLMLVTLAVAVSRATPHLRQREFAGLSGVLAGLVALSYLVSLGVGLFPLQPWDANAFSNYYSHYNALRGAKGALWAACVLWLVSRSIEPGADIRGPFALGMVAGLAGTTAVTAWERIAFTDVWNFSNEYRVTGPFSALHVGGATLECYLVAALPFLGYAIAVARSAAVRLGGVLLFGGGVYGILVTYSRTGLAALLAVIGIMGAALVLHVLRDRSDRRPRILLGILLVVSAAMVAVPVLKGSFAQGRLAHADQDLSRRFAHWTDALRIMDGGLSASLFGMGLGRFPETYFWRTAEDRPGNYRYESENGNVFLRLGSGTPIFVGQSVALKAHNNYVLSLDLRSGEGKPGEKFYVHVCELWLLGSFRCEASRFGLKDAADGWQHHEIAFNSNEIGAGSWYAQRPVRLTLHNPAGVVDVDNVRLIGEDGRDLVANGAFQNGNDRWLVAVDNYWPWHIENFWLHIYFEQGWFGLLSVFMLTACALYAAAKRMWQGDLFAGTLVASIAGFLVIGVLNSPNDNPQLMFLFLLLSWSVYRSRQTVQAGEGSAAAGRAASIRCNGSEST